MLPAQGTLIILRLQILCAGRGQRVFHDQENDSEEEDVGEEAEEEEVESLDGLHAEVGLSLVHTLHSTIVLNYKRIASFMPIALLTATLIVRHDTCKLCLRVNVIAVFRIRIGFMWRVRCFPSLGS
jgi:hypothetical protein